MNNIILFLIAFTVTTPSGDELDEKLHVMGKRFDAIEKCQSFVDSWGGAIRDRGEHMANDIVKDGYTVTLDNIKCVGISNVEDLWSMY